MDLKCKVTINGFPQEDFCILTLYLMDYIGEDKKNGYNIIFRIINIQQMMNYNKYQLLFYQEVVVQHMMNMNGLKIWKYF